MNEKLERVDLLLELANEHFSGDDPQRLIELTDEVLELSRNLDYSKGKAYGCWYESPGCCFTADHEKGLRRVDESRSRLKEMGDSFDQALPPLHAALEFFRQDGNRYWEANCSYYLGLLYHEIKDYPQALENHQKCSEAMEGQPELWLVARALNGVGQALDRMGKSQEALDSLHRGLALFLGPC